MPTRKITRSPVKVTGTAPDGQEFESTLEEDFFVLLRFNPLVAEFEQQPVTMEWMDGDRKIRSYTPDVLVHYRQDIAGSANLLPTLCEIKPDLDQTNESPRRRGPPRTENEEENKLKWAAAESYARERGWIFQVFREKDIRTQLLDNARFLLRHLERPAGYRHDAALMAWLREHKSATLEEWASIHGPSLGARGELLPACYRLIAQQAVAVDLAVRLTLKTTVKALATD